MSSVIPEGSYPIRDFARMTGVNPATLRAWERRYGIIKPLRTPKGHRYYTKDHIQRVNHILHWLEQGYPIRHVELLMSEAEIDQQQDNSAALDEWKQEQQQLLAALRSLNPRRLFDLWSHAFSNYPFAVYYQHCLLPLMDSLRGQPSHPMLLKTLTFLLHQRLTCLMAQQQQHTADPVLLLATNHPDGELDVLIRACSIGAAGLKVEYLGPHLTPAELSIAAESLNAAAVWVHFLPHDKTEDSAWQRHLDNTELPHWLSGTAPLHSGGRPHIKTLTSPVNQQIHTYILGCGGRLDEL